MRSHLVLGVSPWRVAGETELAIQLFNNFYELLQGGHCYNAHDWDLGKRKTYEVG